jgi:hypothetical protein
MGMVPRNTRDLSACRDRIRVAVGSRESLVTLPPGHR